ncbi:MAG: DUF1002 domain-containing protein [Lachnospiraceae bacterium]|nr:DUF1002 domain-containing protein [Lachnospiraceae bacterium]
MKKIKWIFMLCLLTVIYTWSITAKASEEKVSDSIVGYMIEKIADGEVEISDEDSIREAIEAGEQELSVTLTEEEENRIVDFVKSLDAIEVGAEDFMDQAKDLYQKYSTKLVNQANDAINEAVESAVEEAVNSFFQSLKQTVTDFFKNLLSA